MKLTEQQREQITGRFLGYIRGYDLQDPKIRLKMDHSFRVAKLCERIAAEQADAAAAGETSAAGAGNIDINLIWLIGLLHDIGRFEQVRRYGTFVDARSVDHARLGADLLFQEGLLEQISGGFLTGQEQAAAEVSIRNHNRYRIDETLPQKQTAYCNILRDADKIDIFRVLCDTPAEEIYNVTSKQLRSAGVSEEVKECFRRRIAVPRQIRRTPVDSIVGHICLFFELVYPVSRRIALEQGYLDQLLQFSSENQETRTWFAFMRSVLGGRQAAE